MACAEAPETEFETQEQAYVFYERGVDTIRDQWTLASDQYQVAVAGKDVELVDAALHHAVTALHGRTTAIVNAPQWLTVHPTNTGCVDTPHYTRGSAGLISDSRVVTAHHVVFPSAVDMTQNNGCGYLLSFEATHVASTSGDPGDQAGETAPYVLSNTVNDLQLEDTTTNKSTIAGEESPFLANRLFQLGLESWAETSPSSRLRRESLRRFWPFRPDTGSEWSPPHIELMDNLAAAFQEQPYAYLNTTNPAEFQSVGTDLAILEACEHVLIAPTSDGEGLVWSADDSLPAFTPSGAFAINRPAVFFDRTEFGTPTDTDGESLGPEDIAPVIGAFSTNWPDSTFDAFSQLVGRPGSIRGGAGQGCGQIFGPLANTYYCYDSSPFIRFKETNYEGCFEHSLDLAPGASGGSILQAWVNTAKVSTFQRTWVSAVQGAAAPNWVELHTNHGDESDSELHWNPQNSPASRALPDPLIADQVVWMWRDHSNPTNPSQYANPAPAQPSGDGLPTCGPTTGEECASGVHIGADLRHNLGAGFTEVNSGGVGDHPPDETRTTNTSGGKDARTKIGHRFYCETIHEGARTNAGIAVGLLGAQISEAEQPAGVGALRLVCAPWASVSYTDNWRHLVQIGRTTNFADTLLIGTKWGYQWLYRSLVHMVEFRAGRLRPASMKLCPPNFVMVGFRAATFGGDYLEGFTHLFCERPPSNPAPEGYPSRLCVALDPSNANQSCEVDGRNFEPAAQCSGACYSYQLAGNTFSLAQRIGDPLLMPNYDFVCEPGEAVAGLSTTGTEVSPVLGLDVRCVDMP